MTMVAQPPLKQPRNQQIRKYSLEPESIDVETGFSYFLGIALLTPMGPWDMGNELLPISKGARES